MTGFRWLNLEIWDDEFGDRHWKPIEGAFSKVKQAYQPLPASIFDDRQYVVPEYYVALKPNGQYKVIGTTNQVVRLLIPVLGS